VTATEETKLMATASEIDAYTATRRSLQAVAEHVLSAALHASTGRIGLRPAPGGFATPAFVSPNGVRRLRVTGTDLVSVDDRGERRIPLTTVREAAELAGVEPGAPTDVYIPATPLEPDRPLVIAGAAAARLADWYELVARALDLLGERLAEDKPAVVQLWPEHFDLATTISGINYGGSPGDDRHPEPYLYVGPHEPPAPDGGFWNEPFGASRPAIEVPDEQSALAFFLEGHRRARGAPL
jgi:hypothetical protein